MWDESGFLMNPQGAFEPTYRGGPMRLHGGKGGSSAPAPDPALIQAQLKSMGIQDTAIQEIMANAKELAPLQKEQMQFGLDSAKTAYDESQADRSWMLDRRGSLSTLQDKQVTDAANFDTEGRRSELAGAAMADVNQGFSSARDQASRGLSRMGVNPSSGRSLAMGNQTAIAQAAALAGAGTKARTDARTEGYALTDRASNALAGYPAMGMQATGAGASYGTAGLGLANTGLAGLNSGAGAAGSMAASMGSNATGMYGAQASYKNSQDQLASSNDPWNSILGAATGAGMAYATGGLSQMGKKAAGG